MSLAKTEMKRKGIRFCNSSAVSIILYVEDTIRRADTVISLSSSASVQSPSPWYNKSGEYSKMKAKRKSNAST